MFVMTPPAAPASSTGPQVVRLSGPQGIVAAIPHYLGFVPENSLVLLCLTSPRDRVGPVCRIDLPPPGYPEVLSPMLECARRHADSAAIVCYHEGPRPPCIDDLADGLRDRRIPIVATLSVSEGRIRDARSDSAARRDRGMPLLAADDTQAIALRSAAVLAGRPPLPNRAALAASITPTAEGDDAGMRQAIDAALAELAPAVAAAGRRLTPELVEWIDAVLDVLDAEYRGCGRVAAESAARAIALAHHPGSRDLIIARAVSRPDRDTVGFAISVAAQCPDDYCAQWCAVLAVAAYRSGDGALAHCALDRTQHAEPEHRLARLLRSSIGAGLPPASLDVLARIPIPVAKSVNRDADAAE
jgi:hypothetical protein